MNTKIQPYLEDSLFLRIKRFLPDKVKVTNDFGTEVIKDFLIKTNEKEVDTFYFGFLDYTNHKELLNFYSFNVGLVILDKEFFTKKTNVLMKKAFFNNYYVKYAFDLTTEKIYKVDNKIALLVSRGDGKIKFQDFKLEIGEDTVFNIKICERLGFDLLEEIIYNCLPDSFERSFNGKNIRNTTIEYDAYENVFKSTNVFHSYKNDRYLNIVTRDKLESEKELIEELNKILKEVFPIIKPFIGERVKVNGAEFRYGKRVGLAILGIYYSRAEYEKIIV